MVVRPAQRHIMSDIRLEQIIYRIFLLSPFEILQNQQLATTWRIRLYMHVMLLVYYALRISLCLQVEYENLTLQLLTLYGKLWMILDMFDFTFSTFAIGIIVLNVLITNTHQIEFFEHFHDIDTMIFSSFGVRIRRSRTRTANACALVVGLVFFLGNIIISPRKIEGALMTPFQNFAYNFTYCFDNILDLFSALFYGNCTQLCRERLARVRELLRNFSNLSTEQMDTVLQLHVRIRSQIMLINRFMGFVILFKVAHDFTLCSSIVYLMCSSLYRARELEVILELIVWFGRTAIGSVLLTLAAEMLMKEANECAEILASLRTDDISVRKQKWLDNTLLWIRHHAPVLNACGLFPIDLRLLFAMCGGIITFMIVLLQMQDYDDQSLKTLDFI